MEKNPDIPIRKVPKGTEALLGLWMIFEKHKLLKMEYVLNSDDIRNIIFNAHKIKEHNKCHRCEGTGYQNWNSETGNDMKPGPLTDYDSTRLDGECEECDGVGYLDWLGY